MTGRTADSLVSALMLDMWPSMGAITDFGLTESTYSAYQRLIRAGTLTADMLHAHAGDDAWLSEQIGMPVETPWRFILEVVDDDEEAEADEGEEGDNEDIDPGAAYAEWMSEGEYPAPGPNTLSFHRGGTHYILTKEDVEEFPNFMQMDQETFNEALRIWCTR